MVGIAATALNDSAQAATPPELDAALLTACKQLDPAALRTFVVRYQPVLFAYLSRSLGHGPHVEDLAQEAFCDRFAHCPRRARREVEAGTETARSRIAEAHREVRSKEREVEKLRAKVDALRAELRDERTRSEFSRKPAAAQHDESANSGAASSAGISGAASSSASSSPAASSSASTPGAASRRPCNCQPGDVLCACF